MKKYTTIFFSLLFFFYNSLPANAQVVINEFESWKTSGDWIEIYAVENTDISGWIIRDSAESIVKTIPSSVIIGPSTSPYYIIEVGNRLNKESDIIKLLKQDDTTIVDQIAYGSEHEVCAPNENESIGRYPDSNTTVERFKVATKGLTNGNAELYPCPSPTPLPTNTPIPTAIPTATPKPSSTPKPTETIKLTATTKPTSSIKPSNTLIPIITNTNIPLAVDKNDEVLAAETSQVATPYQINSKTNFLDQKLENKNPPIVAIVFVIMGIIFIAISVYPILVKIKKRYNSKDDKE